MGGGEVSAVIDEPTFQRVQATCEARAPRVTLSRPPSLHEAHPEQRRRWSSRRVSGGLPAVLERLARRRVKVVR